MRDHRFKVCSEWKARPKILWAVVRKGAGRGKSQFTIWELLADTRRSQSVPDFLSTTVVGRLVPAPAEEDARSEASEWERRERRKRQEERRVEAEGLGAGGEDNRCFSHALLHGVHRRGV